MINKFFTLSAILLLSVNAWSQTRTVDMEVTLVEPVQNSVLTINQPFNVKINFKNLGPDPVQGGDTLIFTHSGMSQAIAFIIPAGQTIPVNFSYPYSTSFTITSAPSGPVEFCALGILSRGVIVDPDTSNNRSCNTVTFNGTTGVGEIIGFESEVVANLDLYPNPASDLVRLKYSRQGHGSVSIAITDVAGRIALNQVLGVKSLRGDEITIDVSSLTPGMYFVEVVEGSKKARGKIMVR